MRVKIHLNPALLPAAAATLFDELGQGVLFRTQPWLVNTWPAALLPGDQLRLFLLGDDDPDLAPRALLPAVRSMLYGSHPGARVLHFLQRDQHYYSPIGHGVDAAAAADAIGAWLQAHPETFDVVRVSPLDPQGPFFKAIIPALRRSGLWAQIYREGRNRHADVAGLSSAAYLAQRPRALRELLELNTRLLMQGGRGQFNFPCTPELVAGSWPSIQKILDRDPPDVTVEPADYARTLIETAAACGTLRLGIFMLDGLPAAMQLWVISADTARCLRIWDAPENTVFPIDEILTQLMAICLIDGDGVQRLDFGEINEEFAAEWAPGAADRVGIAAFNRRTWRGRMGALRHILLPWLLAPVNRLRRWWLRGRRP